MRRKWKCWAIRGRTSCTRCRRWMVWCRYKLEIIHASIASHFPQHDRNAFCNGLNVAMWYTWGGL